ncbi:MAG: carboxypeptidase regulatory-like domain-containing protein [Acidobacteriaceae bacterium]
MRVFTRSFAFFAILHALSLHAQVDTGSISGTVHDPAGSIIMNATITVTNTADGFVSTVNSNHGGLYTAVDLRPGNYSVTAAAPGFQSITRTGIDLRLQDRLAINFDLAIGQTATLVEVQSNATALETETTSLGQVIENKAIQTLPLNGRNYIQLAILGAGTSPSQRSNERNSFIANGQREIQNSYVLDGIDNKNKIVGFDSSDAQSIEPIIDAIQEFKVQTATFSAEFGQSAGGVVNVSIRSGTDHFHGSAFEYLRNSWLDADPYFQPALTAKPQFIQNQYGATVGGPLLRNHTFFFFAWQSSRISDASPQLAVVPTASQLAGQFGAAIYDPATTQASPSGSGYTRSQFAGNRIPAARFDPVAAKLLTLFPAPNLTGANNFFSNQKETINNNQYVLRLDHRFSDKDTVFAHYIAFFDTNALPAVLPPPASNPSIVWPEAHSFAFSESHIFSPTLLNEARVGYQETREKQTVQTTRQFDQYGIIGAPDLANVTGLPTFAVSGLTTIGTTGPGTLQTAATGSGNLPIDKQGRVIQFNDNLTWQRGRHVLKFGADFQQVTLYANVTLSARPAYSFNGVYTQNPQARTGTGNALADFLLGYTSSSSVSTNSDSESRQHIWQGYVQDDWKVTPTLTINAGLRYELPLPFYETANHYANVILEQGPLYGQLLTASDGPQHGYRRSFVDPNLHNFAPRLGFAWQADPKTVVRAAGGIFYGRDENVPVADRPTNNPPYYILSSYTSDQIDPSIVLATGFPANAISPSNVKTPSVNSYLKHSPTPYVQQWTLNMQRDFGLGFVGQVTYVGSSTHDLYYPNQIDQPSPGPGSVQARRPFPQYSALHAYAPLVSANYNSLQAQIERRFHNGFSLLSAYTWGHAIDNGPSQVDTVVVPQNAFDFAAERGNSAFDVRNRFVTSVLYELPFGKGKPLFANSRVGNAIAGGWLLAGIFSAQSGLWFTPVEAVDSSNTGTTAHPDRIANGNLSSGHRSINHWFDTTAFPTPAQYTFGNSGRDILNGPGFHNIDFGLSRVIGLFEGANLEVRAEAFNLFNTPQFGLPNATLGQPTTAVISSVTNPQRQIQLAARIQF